jgi:hypothetical protein
MFTKIVNLYKNNFLAIFSITFIYSSLSVFFMHSLTPYMAKTDILSAFSIYFYEVGLIMILNQLLRVVFISVFFKLILEIINGNPFKLNQVLSLFSLARFYKLLILEIFIITITIAGMMILIVPGVIWFILVIFSYFIIVDNSNLNILSAINSSIKLSKGFRLKIFLILLVYLIFSLLAYIGIAVAIIIDILIVPFVYFYIAILFKRAKNKDYDSINTDNINNSNTDNTTLVS